MTSKERVLTAMANKQPDMVPVAPDMSNMIPCRLTGKPFWDIYLYQDPPLWKAYVDAVKRFGIDGWNTAVGVGYDWMAEEQRQREEEGIRWRQVIVERTDDRIYTRGLGEQKNGRRVWGPAVNVYYRADPPTGGIPYETVRLPAEPAEWEEIEGVRQWPTGPELYELARREMADRGVTSLGVSIAALGKDPQDAYEYADDPEGFRKKMEKQAENQIRVLECHLKLKPDFILIGNSGMLTFNSPAIFRDLGLWQLKLFTKMCKEAGVLSQVHCCGREYELVKAAAEESDLDSINPLEIPPMGDCDLAQIKREYGRKLSLMGNLHTTDVMLTGSADDVAEASKKAINDAGRGGGFILSTGDQCGRDTPDENILAMVDVARSYGRY